MQPTPTILELLLIVIFDLVVVASALAIGWWFARRNSYLWTVLVPAPLFIPVVWGLHAMTGRLNDAACSDSDWFCFSPVEYHWLAFIAGSVIASLLLTALGFLVAIGAGIGQLARHIRARRVPAVQA